MKHVLPIILMLPIFVSISSGGLMIVGSAFQNNSFAWIMWEIMLVATILALFIISSLLVLWLIQLTLWRKASQE